MKIITVSEMKELDRKAIEEFGISSITLMENAGRNVAEIAIDVLKGASGKKVAIFCGTGNNGGDGFVAGRYLLEQGIEVLVYIIGDKARIKNDPLINLNKLEKMGVKINKISLPIKIDATLIIDAIFGIGLKGEVKGEVRDIITDLNNTNIPIISIDIPSGMDADTGKILGEAIKAKKTVTMQFPKKGFYIGKASEHTGEVITVDIGIPKELCVE